MIKNFLPIAALAFSTQFNAFSQVGIGTTTPVTTLEVKGAPTNTTIADGLILPRLTGNQLRAKDAVYGLSQTRTIIQPKNHLLKNHYTGMIPNKHSMSED